MSLFKRHIGRRVAGVGVTAALLVLGLEAPAFAAPAVTSFTPASGPAGCVVVITGTGFTDSADSQTHVFFGAAASANEATDRLIVSATEIWAVVPTGGTTGPIFVSNLTGTGNSATSFTVTTTTAGGCAPTITSFAPTCGAVGTVVTITGTNLLKSSDAETTPTVVKFSPATGTTGITATHTRPNVDTPTLLSVIVPSGVGDGPISVQTFTTPDSTVVSTASFQVPPPVCPVVEPTEHARSITLSLRKHLVARGVVSSTEDPAFTECVAGVPVKIQRRRAGAWRTVGTATTNDSGAYKKRIRDRVGKYRARATKVTLGDPVTDTCLGATSPRRTHRH